MRLFPALILLLIPFSTLPIQQAIGQEETWILHTYEVKFRLEGQISTTQVYTRLDFQHLAKVYDAAHPRAKKR